MSEKTQFIIRSYEPKDKEAVERLTYQLFMVDSVRQLRSVVMGPRNLVNICAVVLPLSFGVRSIARLCSASSSIATALGVAAGGAGCFFFYMLPKIAFGKAYQQTLDTDMKNIMESYVEKPRCGWFVAEDPKTNQVVGMLAIRPVQIISETLPPGCTKDWDPETTAQLQHVCLDPAYRGKGVGLVMWKETMKWIKENGYARVMLYSSSAARNAVFYAYPRWGFKIKTQTRPNGVPFFLSNIWLWEMVTEDF